MRILFIFITGFFLVFVFGCGDETPLEPIGDSVLTMESNMLNLINQERSDNGILYSYMMDSQLRTIARAYSEQMRDEDFFSHTDPSGEGFADRLSDAGVNFQYAGENIAYNENSTDPVSAAHQGLMNSPTHRANILNTGFTRIGIGIARNGNEYWFTQIFVQPTGKSNKLPRTFVKRAYQIQPKL